MIADLTHAEISISREDSQCIDVTQMGSPNRRLHQISAPNRMAEEMFIDVSTWGYGEGFTRYFEGKVLGVQRFDQTFEVGNIARFTMEGFLQEGKGCVVMAHERCHLCQAPLVETHEDKKKRIFSAGDEGRPKFDPYGELNKKSTSAWRTVNVYTFTCGTSVEYDSDTFEDFGTVVTLGDRCVRLKP